MKTAFKVIRITVIVLLFALCAALFVRIWVQQNYYPASMKKLHFTDALTAHYTDRGGDMQVLTQSIAIPYESSKNGCFFADRLQVVREAGFLQVCVRYNNSSVGIVSTHYERLGILTEPLSHRDGLFDFTLEDNLGHVYKPVYTETVTFWMYHYVKLVFEEVDFSATVTPGEDGDVYSGVNWMRLNVRLTDLLGADPTAPEWTENTGNLSEEQLQARAEALTAPFGSICVYEFNERYHTFSERKLPHSEVPTP